MLTRRTILQAAGATAGLGLLPRRLQAQLGATATKLQLKPVLVSRGRVLRTVVGLRPFRPTGYVVRSEERGAQTIVHHYGHGGCGVTLSWGTAELAVGEVLRAKAVRNGAQRIAVLGCGAVGLATARLLQQQGLAATIYARDLPPHTCSDVAGARWYPFDLFDAQAVTPEFLTSLWKASRAAYKTFRTLAANPRYGIFFRPTYLFQNASLPKGSLLQFDSPIHDLLPGLRALSPSENPTESPVTRTFETMMIEPATYLPALMQDHERAGGRIVQRAFNSTTKVAGLEERVVVNCTGLGAAALFGDDEMYPIKGQLTILKPQSEIDYVALPHGLYMFPRHEGIVLGGTFERHISTLEPNLAAKERILDGHAKFFASLRQG